MGGNRKVYAKTVRMVRIQGIKRINGVKKIKNLEED